MKRFLGFLIICLASMNFCFASDFASVVLPSSYIRKDDGVMLYSKNLEEVFGECLVKTFSIERNYNAPRLASLKTILSTNPQLNSMISREEKVVIVSKICGANKVVSINVKYEITGIDKSFSSPFDTNGIIKDNNSLRISTRVEVYDTVSDRCVWTNIYYKSFNFDSINSKDISLIENYYSKLADRVLLEIKSSSRVRAVEDKKPVVQEKPKKEVKPKKQREKRVSKPVQKPVQQPTVSAPKLKPQLQMKENIGEEKCLEKAKKPVQPVVKKEQKVAKPKVEKTVKPAVKKEQSKPKVEKKAPEKKAEKKILPVTKKVEKKVEPAKKVEQKPVKQPKQQKVQKQEKSKLKLWDKLKESIQVDVKPSTPVQEYKPAEQTPQTVQPSNMHVKLRMNSKNFKPKYDNSVNDI